MRQSSRPSEHNVNNPKPAGLILWILIGIKASSPAGINGFTECSDNDCDVTRFSHYLLWRRLQQWQRPQQRPRQWQSLREGWELISSWIVNSRRCLLSEVCSNTDVYSKLPPIYRWVMKHKWSISSGCLNISTSFDASILLHNNILRWIQVAPINTACNLQKLRSWHQSVCSECHFISKCLAVWHQMPAGFMCRVVDFYPLCYLCKGETSEFLQLYTGPAINLCNRFGCYYCS